MKRFYAALCSIFFSCTVASQVSAQVVTIYRGGIMMVPNYSTIDSAIKASAAGDSLVLSPHTFTEHDLVINKHLVIKGTYAFPDSSVIDADTLGRAINIVNASKVKIEDVIIENGSTDSLIAKGDPGWGGGIQAASGSNLTLSGGTIVRNNTSGSGSLYLSGGGVNGHIVVIRDNVQIRDNSGGIGGGISASSLNMSGNVVVSNNFGGGGAGVYCGGCNLSGNVTIENNTAQRGGNGAGILGATIIMSGNVTVSGNRMLNPLYTGGGIACTGNLQMSGAVKVINNSTTTQGGGIFLGDDTGIPAVSNITDSVLIADNAAVGEGGAVFSNNSSFVMNGGQIVGNLAHSGAAVFSQSGTTNLKNVRIYNPSLSGTRQNEVYTAATGSERFETASCWWGESDTTGLIINEAGTVVKFTSRVVANWTLNDGLPVGTKITYPVRAHFTLQDSTSLPKSSFKMLEGYFTASGGSFAPPVVSIDTNNIIVSTYSVPLSGAASILCIIDADTFKASSTGVGIHEIAGKELVRVSPNPFDHTLSVSVPESWEADLLNIKVTTVTGSVVADFRTTGNGLNEQLNAIVPNLLSGNYLLMLGHASDAPVVLPIVRR